MMTSVHCLICSLGDVIIVIPDNISCEYMNATTI